MASSKFVYLLVLLLQSIAYFVSSFEPLNNEVLALIHIRAELNDPHGVLNNWDEDSVDPCSWAMITCSSENSVIGLCAPNNSLSGTLSGAIANLTNLEQVLLQNNYISGKIPSELGLLPKLQTLDLSGNNFSGTVPDSIGRLSSLRYLRLNNNSLSGSFPSSLSRIPQLSFLDLSYNNLSGPVPQFPARTFNIVGNPLICGDRHAAECSGTAVPVNVPTFPSLLESSEKRAKNEKLAAAIGASLGSAVVGLLFIGLLLFWRKRLNNSHLDAYEKQEDGKPPWLGNLRHFGFRELQTATDNFNPKNILGKGGFGDVYRGRLSDGTVVAVKRLKDGGGSAGESQFRTEVEMISLAVHRNLLRLIGYCTSVDERILVYPFMPNGSVAYRLRVKPALDWNTRKRIALGTARGLLYLHEQCDPKIIHRDVKAANVLLDDACEAVVGDFGLAKLLDHGDSHVTTAVRGTVGHIAPEYLSTGQSSDKTDVFGFGILLLELVTGRRALDFGKGKPHQKGAMLDWVRKVHQEKKLDLLVDKDLRSNYDRIEVGEMVQIALLCTQFLPANRPKMLEVVRMLEGDGLVDKWEACNKPAINTLHTSERKDDNYAFFLTDPSDPSGDDDDDDGRSVEYVEEMELSGPR